MNKQRSTRIKGYTPEVRLPVIGKISLGIKKETAGGKEYPSEVDYLVVKHPKAQSVYGDAPKSIKVLLPLEDDTVIYQQWYASYKANKISCRGDGEFATRWQDGKRVELPCPHPENCSFAKENKCSKRTVLYVILPEISIGGVFRLETGSVVSEVDIYSGIKYAKAMIGRSSWVPMLLERHPIKMIHEGKAMTHHCLKLVCDFTEKELPMLQADNRRMLALQANYLLPAPEDIPQDTDEMLEGVVDTDPKTGY